MADREGPATGAGGQETAARGYRHTPGNEPGAQGAGAGGTAPEIGGDRGGEDAFGADPGGRERFDAAAAYGSDVDPNEMGGLDPAAGATATGADPGELGSGTVGARVANQQGANVGGAGAGMSGRGGASSSRR